jgi:hypothetical protein
MSSGCCRRSARLVGELSAARVAIAHRTQIMPGINAAGVAIVPIEADGISPYGMNVVRSDCGFKYRKRCCRLRLLLAWRASLGFAFFYAGCAWARGTQPGKRPAARVAIFPYDFDASSLRLVDADVLRVDGLARKFNLGTRGLARYIFRKDADAFVAHTLFLHLNAARCLSIPPFEAKRLQ